MIQQFLRNLVRYKLGKFNTCYKVSENEPKR